MLYILKSPKNSVAWASHASIPLLQPASPKLTWGLVRLRPKEVGSNCEPGRILRWFLPWKFIRRMGSSRFQEDLCLFVQDFGLQIGFKQQKRGAWATIWISMNFNQQHPFTVGVRTYWALPNDMPHFKALDAEDVPYFVPQSDLSHLQIKHLPEKPPVISVIDDLPG